MEKQKLCKMCVFSKTHIFKRFDHVSNNENMTFSVEIEGREAENFETPSFVIANAAPMTTALAQGAEQPNITDGKLDLTWLEPQTTSDKQFLSLAQLVLSPADAKKQSDSIRHERAATITLTFDKPTAYAVDGEIYEGNSLTIKTVPRSLTVLTNFSNKD